MGSPLAQGRGLKRLKMLDVLKEYGSPLAQGRGLKHFRFNGLYFSIHVAPCTGAWIETSQ